MLQMWELRLKKVIVLFTNKIKEKQKRHIFVFSLAAAEFLHGHLNARHCLCALPSRPVNPHDCHRASCLLWVLSGTLVMPFQQPSIVRTLCESHRNCHPALGCVRPLSPSPDVATETCPGQPATAVPCEVPVSPGVRMMGWWWTLLVPPRPPLLTCQLMRLDRFSTISRYSVRVGGPYL